MKLLINRSQQAFKAKGQIADIVGIAGHIRSVSYIPSFFFPYNLLKNVKTILVSSGLHENRPQAVSGHGYSLLNPGL